MTQINKIFIIGIVASGKTTLAKQLSMELDIPWFELVSIVHNQTAVGRTKRTPQEQLELINEIDKHGSWIFEGTDRASYQCLYEMADRIIVADPPLWQRCIKIVTRFLKQISGIEKSHYKPDLQMLKMMFKWTNDFEKLRDEFEGKVSPFKHKVFRLTNYHHKEFIKEEFKDSV